METIGRGQLGAIIASVKKDLLRPVSFKEHSQSFEFDLKKSIKSGNVAHISFKH
jgi:hypothetical protein